MHKMQATSVVDLVRMTDRLRLSTPEARPLEPKR
jgi:hypothetical protein